jgi:hypothetical protein
MPRPRKGETPKQREQRIREKARQRGNTNSAEDEAMEAMVKQSIDVHGA